MMSTKQTAGARPGPRIRQVPAVSRAIAILRLLGTAPEPMPLKAVADALSLVPSTCLHILRVLIAEGLVKLDSESKRYALDSGMLVLARSVIERNGFASLAQPGLDRLALAWGISTMGVEIQDSEHMVVLALSRSRMPFALHADVGSRFPALISATGRLFAAFGGQPWPQMKRRFAALRWSKPIDFDTWKSEVELAREAGFAVDRDTYISGVTIVAVPLLDAAGRVTHALVGAGLTDQWNVMRVDALARDMQREAKQLSPLLVGRN